MFRVLSCAFGCVTLCFAASAAADEVPPAPAADLPAFAQPLTDEALANRRGGFLAGLGAVFGAAPKKNTVSVQVGADPPQTASGSDPQSINLGDFSGSAGTGTGSPLSVSITSNTSTTTTRTFTRSYSLP